MAGVRVLWPDTAAGCSWKITSGCVAPRRELPRLTFSRRREIHGFAPAKTAPAVAAIAEIRDPESTWNPHALHVLLALPQSQSIMNSGGRARP